MATQNTLKRMKLLKNLETSKTLMEAGIKAGYSPGARTIYRPHTRRHIAEKIGNDPKKIIDRYENLIKEARKQGDLSTERACLDSLSRINAMFRDKSEITTKNDIKQEELDPVKLRKTLEDALKSDITT